MTLLIGFLLATTGLNFTPGVRLSANQYLSDMTSTYGMFPELGLSARLDRTRNIAMVFELCGDYNHSLPWTGNTNLVTASLRIGPEFRTSPANEFYVTPGLQITHAAEEYPSYDTTSGAITQRWYQGTSMGFFTNVGTSIVQAGGVSFGVELGLTLVAIPTNYPLIYSDYYTYAYRTIDRSSLSLGILVQRAGKGY